MKWLILILMWCWVALVGVFLGLSWLLAATFTWITDKLVNYGKNMFAVIDDFQRRRMFKEN